MKYILILLIVLGGSAKAQIIKSSDTVLNVEYGLQAKIIYDSVINVPLKSKVEKPQRGQIAIQHEWVYYYYDGKKWIRLTNADDK